MVCWQCWCGLWGLLRSAWGMEGRCRDDADATYLAHHVVKSCWRCPWPSFGVGSKSQEKAAWRTSGSIANLQPGSKWAQSVVIWFVWTYTKYMCICMHMLHLHVYMYDACMYGCMYGCMCGCVDVWMYAWMHVWMYACMIMYACMHVWMYGSKWSMDVWMDGCMDAWMYGCRVGG